MTRLFVKLQTNTLIILIMVVDLLTDKLNIYVK